MNTVVIVGVGLIGGSFGLALRAAGFAGDLIGVSSPSSIQGGLQVGAIDRSASLEEAAPVADLIYLAQPVNRILLAIQQLATLVRPGALITDAGSTKEAIVSQAITHLPGIDFLGGHPIAGKERRGVEAAEPDLFRNRPYILTPHRPATEASGDFRSWLERIGSRIIDMPPAEHDATLAFTSHLPQLVSTALGLTLARQHDHHVSEVFGSGLLDMTRLAISSPELWAPILSTNKTAVLKALADYQSSLVNLQEAIENDNLVESFEIASTWVRQLRPPRLGTS